jgi:hypothetical protein
MTQASDGGQPLKISEVSAGDMPNRRTQSNKWEALYRDIRLRLERTLPQYALRCQFATIEDAKNAKARLYVRFKRDFGAGQVRFSTSAEDDGGILYVARGPEYRK